MKSTKSVKLVLTNSVFRFILFLVILCCTYSGFSNEATARGDDQDQDQDQVQVPEHREIDQQRIDKYHEDPDFNYAKPLKKEGLWSLFLTWLDSQLNRISPDLNWPLIINILLYGLIAFAVIMILNSIFGKGLSTVLYKSKKGKTISFSDLEENPELVDWEKLIDEAIEEKRYRVAVRLLYIYTLQILAKSGRIIPNKDKTNAQYLLELKDDQLKNKFRDLTHSFDYVWFGNIKVNQEQFYEIHRRFRSFMNSNK